MTPSERRAACIRLLATIDQQIAEARALTEHPDLDHTERDYAAGLLAYREREVKRVEAVIHRAK